MATFKTFLPSVNDDRLYDSITMTKLFSQFVKDGYVEGYLNDFNIYEDNIAKQIVVDTGGFFYQGHWYSQDEETTFGIPLNTTPDTQLYGIIIKINREPLVRNITLQQLQSSNGIDFVGDLDYGTLNETSGINSMLLFTYEVLPGQQEALNPEYVAPMSNASGMAPDSLLDLFNQHIAKIVNENDGSGSGHLTGDMYKSLLDTDNQLLAQLAGATFSDDETSSSNSEFLSARAINQKIADSSLPSYLPEAQYIGYDNTTSGLTAENMQDALDEAYSQMGTATGSSSALALGNARDLAYLLAMKEIDNRAIDYTQKFYNIPDLDAAVNCVLDDWQELMPSDVSVGQTVFSGLTDTSTLGVGKELTIQDSLSKEVISIVSIDSATQITTTATTNAFTTSNNAVIYRSLTNEGQNASFNGTTSKATGVTETSTFDIGTIILDASFDNSSTLEVPRIVDFNVANGGVQQNDSNGNLEMNGDVQGKNTYTYPINGIGEKIIVIKWNGTTYDAYADGALLTIGTQGNTGKVTLNQLGLGFKESLSDSFWQGSIKDLRISSTIITDQQAIEITAGTKDVGNVLNKFNTEIIYTNLSSFTNDGSLAGEYDLITTDVTFSGLPKQSPYDKRYKVELPADTLVAWAKKNAYVQSLSSTIATLDDGETETYVATDESNYGTSELQSMKTAMDETKAHSILKYEVTYDTNGEVGDIDRILGVTDTP